MTNSPEISVVVPLFNEQENVAGLYRRLVDALTALGDPYEIVFVDDGSKDSTPSLIDALHEADSNLVVIHLSRNFGHQAAVSAGVDHARGRAVMVMDGDLQDPPEVIPQFVRLWRDGYEVVYAVRRHRKEGLVKRAGYSAFYRILGAISDLEIPLDSGDFCLMDRRVVEALKGLPERKRFVRGLRTFVGFRQIGLVYERAAREAGTPKYTFRALVGLAVDGLVSFSSYPLRLVTYLGFATAFFALMLAVWGVTDAITARSAPRGWASTLVIVLFLGSIQLISLGIVGEYVRLIFLETKGRPTYIVREHRTRDESPPQMITTWSAGVADDNMAEDILVELAGVIARHPWWRARSILTLALLARLGVRPPARVLDAGCGWGVTLEALERQGFRASGMDISRRTLERLDRPARALIEADLTQPLPAGAETFDAVLALDVIEHLDDDRGAVARLGRMVEPGGVVVVSVPALPDLFTEFDAIQGHRRRYLPETLRAAFEGSGLDVERVFWWGAWMVPMLRRQRARPRSVAGESTAETYRRYLKLPPWPLSAVLPLPFAWERNRALDRKLDTGTSLFAVARRPAQGILTNDR